MTGALGARALARLARRTPLGLDPRRAVAIKRNQHEWRVACDAARLASAFAEVLADPSLALGRIAVRRAPERIGRPFTVGERFHGSLEVGRLVPRLRGLLAAPPLAALVAWLEDELMSDYAQILELALQPDADGVFRARYGYLSGSPVAGHSTLQVVPDGPGHCRFIASFEYQEVGAFSVSVLHRLGIRLHDEVVARQVKEAARRAGAGIVESTLLAA